VKFGTINLRKMLLSIMCFVKFDTEQLVLFLWA